MSTILYPLHYSWTRRCVHSHTSSIHRFTLAAPLRLAASLLLLPFPFLPSIVYAAPQTQHQHREIQPTQHTCAYNLLTCLHLTYHDNLFTYLPTYIKYIYPPRDTILSFVVFRFRLRSYAPPTPTHNKVSTNQTKPNQTNQYSRGTIPLWIIMNKIK